MKEQHIQNIRDANRWTCPRCGRENGSEGICPVCGFDNSTNYLAYPTLMPLPRQKKSPWQEIEALKAEVQRLLMERQRQVEELTRMETALRELRAKEEAYAEGIKRIQTELERLQAAQTVQKRSKNRLRKMGGFSGERSLDGVTPKRRITEVRFLNTLVNAPEDAADLSETEDGRVRCWTRGTVQFIAGEGGVSGGSSCSYLFSGYGNMTAVQFAGNFDTSAVTDMSYMFFGCSALSALDLSGFDTSNVTNMIWMFTHCKSLRSLDLSGWNTSRVRNMVWMFGSCSSLTALNLSGWDTGGVGDMSYMFYHCAALTAFDPAWLDTSHADTAGMYLGTQWENLHS